MRLGVRLGVRGNPASRVVWVVRLAMPVVVLGGLGSATPVGAGAQESSARTPPGLDAFVPTPERNRPTPRRVRLGERLFHDPLLSADGTRACASCHRPDQAFTSPEPVHRGVGGAVGFRNAPSLLNRAYASRFFWDGRASSLEEAVLMPVTNPTELGLTLPEAVKRLRESPEYVAAFRAAYGRDPSVDGLASALSAYLRSLRSGGSAADLYASGNEGALGEAARRGRRLFAGPARCWVCHSGPLLTDEKLHNTGVSWGSPDTGVHLRTGRDADRGRFRTPSLRDVALTAPYMHDGSLATLEEVAAFYGEGGGANPNLDPELRGLHLSEAEQADLVAFLRSLTGGRSPGS